MNAGAFMTVGYGIKLRDQIPNFSLIRAAGVENHISLLLS